MSRDLVYLYELDFPTRNRSYSLIEFRKLPKVIYAYEVIYKTIFIENKNIVLSYDQIVDTLFFQAWYEYDPETVIKLFTDKRFKISRFGGNMTPIAYLKNNLKKTEFRFSGSVENLNGGFTPEQKDEIKDRILNFTNSLNVEVFDDNRKLLSNSNKNKLVKYCLFLLSIASILADASLRKSDSTEDNIEEDLYLKPKVNRRHTLSNLIYVFNHKEDRDYSDERDELVKIYSEIFPNDLDKRSEWYNKIDESDSEDKDKLKLIIDACHNIAVESSIDWKNNGNPLGLNTSASENEKYEYIKRVIIHKEEISIKQKSDVYDIYIDKDLWRLTLASPVYDYSKNLICCKNISQDKQYYCLYKNIKKFRNQSISYSWAIVIFFTILSISGAISRGIANIFLNDDNSNNIWIWILYYAITMIVPILISIATIAIAKKKFKIKFNTIFSQTWNQLKNSWKDYRIKKKMKKIFEKFKDKDGK